MAVSAQGKEARTRYAVLRRYDRLVGREGPFPSTLLEASLETGRTHQIRVHFAAIGHPVVGDDRYGRAGGGRVGGSALPPGRLFLHAAELEFEHPGTGETMRWRSPLPAELAALLGDVPEAARG
jgi:23S rRNA pseudouridine1911/1915/1917 synthase